LQESFFKFTDVVKIYIVLQSFEYHRIDGSTNKRFYSVSYVWCI